MALRRRRKKKRFLVNKIMEKFTFVKQRRNDGEILKKLITKVLIETYIESILKIMNIL